MLVTIKNVKKELIDRDVFVDLHFLTIRTIEETDTVYVLETNLENMQTKRILNFKRNLGDYNSTYARGRKHVRILNRTLKLMIIHRWDDVLICSDEELNRKTDCRVVPTEFYSYYMKPESIHSDLCKMHMADYNEWGFTRAFNHSIDYSIHLDSLTQEQQDRLHEVLYYSSEDIVNIHCLLEAMECLEHNSHDIFRY